MTRYLVLLAIVLLTSACAGRPGVAPYGPMSARGGYQEVQVGPGVWRILARSIGKDGAGYARNMAEYRAGELLKARGFSHVQVLGQNGRWELGKQFGRGRRRVHTNEMEVIVCGAHDRSPPPECHETNAHSCYTQSVESMMAGARPKLEHPPGGS